MEEFANSGLSVVDSVKTDTLKETEAPKKVEPKEESLIITTEEYLDCCDSTAISGSTDPPVEKKTKPTSTTIKNNSSAKVDGHQVLWATNLSRHTKANDLKSFISTYANVKTVKILTDGKEFFGYLLMKSTEDASKCRKHLNGTLFQQHKIHFQYEKPHNRKTKQDKWNNNKEQMNRMRNFDWKDEYLHLKNEIIRLRRRQQEMEREIKHLKMKMSAENESMMSMKNLSIQREKLREEHKLIERMRNRLNADRELLSKSTMEMRGIREDINKKLSELKLNIKDEKMSNDGTKRKWSKNHYSSPKKHNSSNREAVQDVKKYRHRTPSPSTSKLPRSHRENDKYGHFHEEFAPNNTVWPLQEQQNQWRFDGQHFGDNEGRYSGGNYQNSTSRDALFLNQQKFTNNHRGCFERRKY